MAMQALVMGFGGTGAHILTALKELTVLKHGSMPDSIKFLLFDTIADWSPGKGVPILGGAAEEKVAEGSEKATSLDRFTEYFYLGDHDPDLKKHVYTYLSTSGNPDGYPHLKKWLHAPWLSEHVQESRLSITDGAAQQRQIGRFAMFQNADKIVERLGNLIRSLAQPERAGNGSVNIWIIGSSAGGTGAGCFLDAAYMTRLAAGDVNNTLTGVIVLPDVYGDVAGISQARAYSLLRELDRVQEQGVPQSDRYEDSSRRSSAPISSEVRYDPRDKHVARVKAKLFDDLFYLGKDCRIEKQRKAFFTSVANAIDPYLDANSGPVLLQASVNQDAAASSFGAARLYVPVETFTDIFAWEQVEEYLRGAAAPSERGGRVTNVHSGSPNDRKANAQTRVENMLALFGELLERADWPDDQKEKWARSNSLDSEKIITGWYQFAGAAIASEKLTPAEGQAVQLTYVDPFRSLTHTDVSKVPPQELETKTYKENKEARGVKESQEESRDRFANKLEALITQYMSTGGGERTFEKGRRLVFEKVSARLKGRADSLVVEQLQNSAGFAWDPAAPENGTPLTRLYEELRVVNSDDGPLKKIDATISKFLDTLNAEEGQRTQQPVDALHQLRTSRKVGFNPLGVWVEGYQQAAREECSEYVRWYQKRVLLRDMQQVVRSVIGRFAAWERAVGRVVDALVMREGESALYNVRKKYIEQLEGRLLRAVDNSSALMGVSNDTEMDGYRDHLRESSVYVSDGLTLAAQALAASRWEAGVAADGTPELTLVLERDGVAAAYGGDAIQNLHQDLRGHFHREIDRVLSTTDIFNYLLYMREKHGLEPGRVAELLDKAASPLINAGDATEEARLIFMGPTPKPKLDLAKLIQNELKERNASVKDPEQTHSDPNSITLIKIKKPNLSQIVNLEDCLLDYGRWLLEKLNGDIRHDNELYRAQVYHPFRPEMEAWFIERRHWIGAGNFPKDWSLRHLSPRVARLLEHPEMMHAFVQCLATKAVEYVNGEWVWHAPQREVRLSDSEQDADADLFRAAIVFTLQQREVGSSIQTISLPEVKQSAVDAAQKQGKSLEQMLTEFRQGGIETLLKERLPGGARTKADQHFRMVLEFYSDPATRTSLHQRMNL